MGACIAPQSDLIVAAGMTCLFGDTHVFISCFWRTASDVRFDPYSTTSIKIEDDP